MLRRGTKNRKARRSAAKRRKELGGVLGDDRATAELTKKLDHLNLDRLARVVPWGFSPLYAALAMIERDAEYNRAMDHHRLELARIARLMGAPPHVIMEMHAPAKPRPLSEEAMLAIFHGELRSMPLKDWVVLMNERLDSLQEIAPGGILNCRPEDLREMTVEQLLEAAEKFPKPPERAYAGDARVDLAAFARKYFPESLYPSTHDVIARGVCSAAEDVSEQSPAAPRHQGRES